MRLVRFSLAVIIIFGIVVGVVYANHNGAVVTSNTIACGETTVSATIADPAGGHKVTNMYLVVDAGGMTQYANIPTDGSSANITVGPFFDNTTISWNVFGGGERSYDQPLWTGYGTPSFNADIGAYAASQGSFSWVLDGPNNPNPFTNFNQFNVTGCATKDQCKDGGWMQYGFANQGQCIRFVNTGGDSR